MRSLIQNVIAILVVLVLGCSDDDGNGGDTGGGSGDDTGGNNGDSNGDTNGNGKDTSSSNNGDSDSVNGQAPNLEDLDEDAICYEVEQGIGETTGRVMLLQDISSSMNNEVDGQTKWTIAQSALTNMVTAYGDTIEFGLDFFPIDRDCGVGTTVREDAAPNNGANLANVLATTELNRTTPLLMGMSNFLNPGYAPAFMAAGSDPYLVVVSDGMDSCGDANGGNISTEDLATLTSTLLEGGIRTFVIGFGSAVDPDELNAIAENGGTQFTTYFDAQNETDLNQALESIGQAVIVSCRYQLGNVSPDANRDYTNIYFDGQPLTRGADCSSGADWTWGNAEMTIVEFCMDACTLLENDGVSQLNVVIMCNEGDVVVV